MTDKENNKLPHNDEKETFNISLKNIFEETEDLLEQELPLEKEIDFQLSDILAPLCLNNIKNSPKYYYQKFKIHFVKFFSLEEYFFKMEKDKKLSADKSKNQNNLIDNAKSKETIPEPKKTKINELKIKNKKELTSEKELKRKRSVEFSKSNQIEQIKSEIIEKKRCSSAKNKNNSLNFAFNTKDKSNISSQTNKVSNDVKNIKKSSISLSDSSEKNKSLSFSYEQIQGLIGIGMNMKKENKNEENKNEFPDYKLKLIKSNLNLEDNEEMSGKTYEDYVRKILKIMIILVTKNEIFFENPSKINYSKIIDFYLNNYFKYSLDINTPIKNILYNNIQDGNELDIVFDMKYQDLDLMSTKFNKYFLMKRIVPYDNIVINPEGKDKVTLICEIAKNIIRQGKEKLSQILNYIKIITIMNTIKNSSLSNNDKYEKICEDYKCASNTEKIFCIVTNGDYSKMKNIMNYIQQLLSVLSEFVTQEQIKTKISDYVNSNNTIIAGESNLESLKENIYSNYLIFNNLQKNKIKYALIYIGDITNINYEEIFKKILKREETIKENIINVKKEKIKPNYTELKIKIKEFERKLSDITAPHINDLNPIFQEIPKSIGKIPKLSDCSFIKKIYKSIHFDAFIYYQKSDMDKKSLYKDIESSPAINKLKAFFNLKYDNLTPKQTIDLINNVKKSPEQYGKKIIFLVYEFNYFEKNIHKKFFTYFPSIIKNIFYCVNANKTKSEPNKVKLNVAFDFPDDFLNGLPLKNSVNKQLDKELKKIKTLFTKNCSLCQENLPAKIIHDLNYLFEQNEENYSFIDIIKNTEFDIYNGENKDLVKYHDKALKLFEEISVEIESEKRCEIIDNTTSKINKLIDNVFSLNIYTIIFDRIKSIIGDIISENIKNEILKFKFDIEKFDACK